MITQSSGFQFNECFARVNVLVDNHTDFVYVNLMSWIDGAEIMAVKLAFEKNMKQHGIQVQNSWTILSANIAKITDKNLPFVLLDTITKMGSLSVKYRPYNNNCLDTPTSRYGNVAWIYSVSLAICSFCWCQTSELSWHGQVQIYTIRTTNTK